MSVAATINVQGKVVFVTFNTDKKSHSLAIASYLKVVWPRSTYYMTAVSRGSGGIHKNFVTLDAKRSLLRPF